MLVRSHPLLISIASDIAILWILYPLSIPALDPWKLIGYFEQISQSGFRDPLKLLTVNTQSTISKLKRSSYDFFVWLLRLHFTWMIFYSLGADTQTYTNTHADIHMKVIRLFTCSLYNVCWTLGWKQCTKHTASTIEGSSYHIYKLTFLNVQTDSHRHTDAIHIHYIMWSRSDFYSSVSMYFICWHSLL